MELRQEPRLVQQLVITPQLQQALRLLQLSNLELCEVVERELKENPVLEEAEGWEEGEGIEAYLPLRSSDEEGRRWEDFLVRQVSLNNYLLWQLRMSHLTPSQMEIGVLIIGNIDEDGYLRASCEEIAQELGVPPGEVREVLEVIQSFDPPGVGARDLRECLLIQLRERDDSPPLAEGIIEGHWERFKGKDYEGIARSLGVDPGEVREAVDFIMRLEPRPGRPFGPEATKITIPDVLIYKKGEEFEVSIIEDGLPPLRLNPLYERMVSEGDADMPLDYLKERLRAAQWLIRCLHQRRETLYRVTKSIARFQREFLEKGIDYLRPLVLRDVAEDVGMHESTVSRVTTNKFASTPQGIFELKFFFSGRVGEGDVSVIRVKKLIREIIADEDKGRPYSDAQLCKILKMRYNIDVARRTVTKYREGMGIPSSHERRAG